MSILYPLSSVIFGFLVLLSFWKKKYLIGISSILGYLTIIYLVNYYVKSNNGEIKVAIAADYYPYAYVENNKIKGIDIHTLNKIGDYVGKKVVFQVVSFDEVEKKVESGEVDLGAGGLSATENNEKKVWKKRLVFSESYGYTNSAIVVKKGTKLDENFSGKLFIQKNTPFMNIARRKFPKCKIILKNNFQHILEEFKKGNCDGVVADSLVLAFFTDENKDYIAYKIKQLRSRDKLKGSMFLVGRTIDINELNKAIIRNRDDNSILDKIEELLSI